MDGCLPNELILALAAGTLSGDDTRSPSAHLEGCADCRHRLAVAQAGPPEPRLSPTLAPPAARKPIPHTAPLIGRYRVLRELGRGSMGVVLLAEDTLLGRQVALKAVGAESATGQLSHHVTSEARAIARLQHPNVVGLYDVLQQDGQVYLAMEYVEGGDLQAWMAGPGTVGQRLEIFLQVAAGLEAAHGAGVVHRDFKPANVLVGSDGRARVSDFGLATMQGEHDTFGHRAMVGTPAYMAPEQFAGKLAGAAADQFAFCAALFEALTGQRPYAGEDLAALREAVTKGPPAMRGLVPPRVAAVLSRGLAVDPVDRFGSMRELRLALSRANRAGNVRPWALAAAGLVVVLAGLGFAARPADPCRVETTRLAKVWPPPKLEASPPIVRTELEATVREWNETFLGQCHAWRAGTVPEPEWERTRGCLDAALDDLESVAAASAVAGEGKPAAVLLQYVARPHACASSSNTVRTRIPLEATARQKVVETLAAFVDIAALDAEGDNQAALARAATAVELALAANHPPTSARALLVRARFEYNSNAHDASLRSLERARALAMGSGALRELAYAGIQAAFDDCRGTAPDACRAQFDRVRPMVEALDAPWLKAYLEEMRVGTAVDGLASPQDLSAVVDAWKALPGAELELARSQRRYARALVESGDAAGALALTLELLPPTTRLVNLKSCEIALLRAQALASLGHLDEAFRQLDVVEAAAEHLKWENVKQDVLFLRTAILADQGQPAEVLLLLRPDIQHAWAQVRRLEALVQTGRFEEAQQTAAHLSFPAMFTTLSEYDRSQLRYLKLLIALEAKDTGVLEHAAEWLGKDLDPGLLAATLTRRGLEAQARDVLRRAPEESWMLAVELAQREHRWTDALALLEANASEVTPSSKLEAQLRTSACHAMIDAAPAAACARFNKDLAQSRASSWFSLLPNEVERLQAAMKPRCR